MLKNKYNQEFFFLNLEVMFMLSSNLMSFSIADLSILELWWKAVEESSMDVKG